MFERLCTSRCNVEQPRGRSLHVSQGFSKMLLRNACSSKSIPGFAVFWQDARYVYVYIYIFIYIYIPETLNIHFEMIVFNLMIPNPYIHDKMVFHHFHPLTHGWCSCSMRIYSRLSFDDAYSITFEGFFFTRVSWLFL